MDCEKLDMNIVKITMIYLRGILGKNQEYEELIYM